MEEFYIQGDQERNLKIQTSAFCDRTKPAECKCQLGFIEFVVAPLYDIWTEMSPELKIAAKCLEENRRYWKKRQEFTSSTGTLETLILEEREDRNAT